MKHVKITTLNKLGQDERGSTYTFSIRETSNFIVAKRKSETLSGNTYHEGKNRGTNPKMFVLVQGEIEFRYRHIEEKESHKIEIMEPSIIEIQPFVTHAVWALSDIIMLECNSIEDIQADRHRLNV